MFAGFQDYFRVHLNPLHSLNFHGSAHSFEASWFADMLVVSAFKANLQNLDTWVVIIDHQLYSFPSSKLALRLRGHALLLCIRFGRRGPCAPYDLLLEYCMLMLLVETGVRAA